LFEVLVTEETVIQNDATGPLNTGRTSLVQADKRFLLTIRIATVTPRTAFIFAADFLAGRSNPAKKVVVPAVGNLRSPFSLSYPHLPFFRLLSVRERMVLEMTYDDLDSIGALHIRDGRLPTRLGKGKRKVVHCEPLEEGNKKKEINAKKASISRQRLWMTSSHLKTFSLHRAPSIESWLLKNVVVVS
jgi:hypothetical protein